MRRTNHLAFLLILVASPLLFHAQFQPKLVIDTPIVTNPPDTLYYTHGTGDSIISYDIRLRNIGPAGANGLVDIIFQYKDTVEQVKMTLNVDLENSQFFDTVVVDTVRGTQARYGGGVNIIVIWPRAHPDVNALPPDTSEASIVIDQIVSRPKPKPVEDRVFLYPNPADAMVKVGYKKSSSRLELVRILNMEGREVYQNTLPVTELPFKEHPNGIYFVEFQYADGQNGLFKVVIQH